MESQTFRSAWSMLAATWPERLRDLGPAEARDLAGIYAAALADLTDAELKRATAAAIRESTYFPKPAELRRWARPGGDPDPELRARYALAREQATAPTPASHQLPAGDPETAAAMEAARQERLREIAERTREVLARAAAAGRQRAPRRPRSEADAVLAAIRAGRMAKTGIDNLP